MGKINPFGYYPSWKLLLLPILKGACKFWSPESGLEFRNSDIIYVAVIFAKFVGTEFNGYEKVPINSNVYFFQTLRGRIRESTTKMSKTAPNHSKTVYSHSSRRRGRAM